MDEYDIYIYTYIYIYEHGTIVHWIGLREILRQPPFLMVKNMVSCRFSLKPIQ